MNTLRSLSFIASLFFSIAMFGQPSDLVGNIEFSLQKISDQTWGVYAKPSVNISPSTQTTTGSGQVTLVAPKDFAYTDLKNMGGAWVENARVDGPVEAHNKSYISFGFVTDSPKLNLYPNELSLLFTILVAEEFEGSFALFENGNDPFAVPNSYESNPGNDIGIIDYGGESGLQYYTYAGNSSMEPAVQVFTKKSTQQKTKAKAVFTSEVDSQD